MPFLALPADILIAILSIVDVSTIIAVSRTCKRAHEAAITFAVWKAALEDLHARRFIDHLPVLHGKTTLELVAIVKRLLRGPDAWSSSTPQMRARPYLERTLPHTAPLRAIQLLEGGEYVMVFADNCLRCMRVAGGQPVLLLPIVSTALFQAEIVDVPSATELRVFIWADSLIRVIAVELVDMGDCPPPRVDLSISMTGFSVLRSSKSTLADNLVAAECERHSDRGDFFLLLDWEAGRYCALGYPQASTCTLSLVPGFIVSTFAISKLPTSTMPSGPLRRPGEYIEVRSIAALSKCWKPVKENSIPHLYFKITSLHAIPTVASQSLGVPESSTVEWSSHPLLDAQVFPSPIARDTFRVWVSLYSPPLHEWDPPVRWSAQVSFRLELRAGSTRLTQRSCAFDYNLKRRDQAIPYTMSYVGHMMVGGDALGSFLPTFAPASGHARSPKNRGALVHLDHLEGMSPVVHGMSVSTWSGALTYVGEGKIVVAHYL
ncbi:hypothetical protein MKEN_01122700 [Mycena kentingensis (nom. inval.)]|nr:hypothetical protein MKEN_01122700 [Mycena kentingensis (nom. inval.)]